jgi:hypothetical protein
MNGGEVKHFWSDDIKIYGNPMNGKGWDVDNDSEIMGANWPTCT